MNKRQIVAGTIAAVLTLGAAAAAVVVNVGAASPQDTSPAGKLASTEVVTAPPSTIYVDVTVPDLPPGSVPRTDATASSSSASSAVGHDEDSRTDDEHAERVEGRTDDD